MPTANAVLLDRAVDHEHDLIRFERGVVLRMIAVLNRADARLSAQLSEALLQIDAGSFTVERLESLLASVRQTNAEAYAAVFAELEPELQALARAETSAQASALRSAVPAAVQLRFPIAAIAWEQVYAAALSRPFQGRLLRDWAAAVPEQRMTQIREAVRAGFVEGQTTADIIRRVRGTKALRFEDGILARPRRELATILQTALSHTAQTARQVSYDANADLVKALRWVSTLDNRTSPMCRVRDGLLYTATKPHKPIGHKVPFGDGPGRLHFNCRSVSVPVLKSWRELGIDADELPAGTRASMDGAVPAEMTYKQWLARQSTERQNEILGIERAKLYRAGKLSFESFYDDKGKFLSLAELLAKI
jgi:SPP1 gp7 family putative phage head morphogenesis protein